MSVNGSERPSDPALVVWAARRVVEQHKTPPEPLDWRAGCARCSDGECDLLAWAVGVLAERDRRDG